MKTFSQYLEMQYRGNMDDVTGTPIKAMTIRDPNLQRKAGRDLSHLFADRDKTAEVLTKPEVRARLIPLIEKDPELRTLLYTYMGHISSLAHRQDFDKF